MIIGIGDERQSIYGFRGATNALSDFIELTNAGSLPMNISRRCSVAVVTEANNVFEENPIQSLPNAPIGAVSTVEYDEFLRTVIDGDFVLCRTNLPLVKACYSLLKRKVKAYILGRDIGFQLIGLLKQLVKDNNTEDIAILATAAMESAKINVKLLLSQNKDMEATSVMDRHESLLVFFEGCKTIAEIEEKIKETFKDNETSGVCLSTVHKIKGAESNNVYILNPELMPHPKSRNPHEEKCIKFVAITRAKLNLYYVKENQEKELE